LAGKFVDYHSELLSNFQNWKMIGLPKAVAPLMLKKSGASLQQRFGGGIGVIYLSSNRINGRKIFYDIPNHRLKRSLKLGQVSTSTRPSATALPGS
jgi:hypothetical protein